MNTFKELFRKYPVVTYVLIGINFLIYVLETIAGGSQETEVAVAFGAFYTPFVVIYHEYYRLVTAMFLHFGIDHLGSNMVSLFVLGPYVEKYFGRVRFLFIYFIAGLCGNVLTLFMDFLPGAEPALSAGASGAICGLLGVFIVFAMTPGIRRYFPMKRVLFGIVFSLAPGLGNAEISLRAHVGGLIGGFLTALFFQKMMELKRR